MKRPSDFDKWILTRLSYEVKNQVGDKHKWTYLSDLFVLIVYSGLSLYNALAMIFPNLILTTDYNSSPSKIAIILNIFILIRLNISIYIKKKENISVTEDKLSKDEIIKKIEIKVWQYRLGIVYAGYIMAAVISLFYICYGEIVSKSLGFIGIIVIVETFINSFLDNLTARYEAIPEIYTKI